MQKLVVKTAVKTVLIIVVIIIAVFSIFNFAFPQHMATAMESLGNYSMAVKYANLRYMYTGDSFDLARCYDDSVLASDDGAIIYYAEKLISDKNYNQVCTKRNQQYNDTYLEQLEIEFNYDVRVRSTLAVSYYNEATKKEGEERSIQIQKAISFALSSNDTESFVYGNALMSLSKCVVNKADKDTAQILRTELDGVTPALQTEKNYVSDVKEYLDKFINDNN